MQPLPAPACPRAGPAPEDSQGGTQVSRGSPVGVGAAQWGRPQGKSVETHKMVGGALSSTTPAGKGWGLRILYWHSSSFQSGSRQQSPSMTSILLLPIFTPVMSSEHFEAPKERGDRRPRVHILRMLSILAGTATETVLTQCYLL